MSSSDIFQDLKKFHDQGTPCALVTLIQKQGSVPQEIGAKAIISRQGLVSGTIGGGKLEAFVITQSQFLLDNQKCENCKLLEINLNRDLGMTCGGNVQVLIEIFKTAQWRVAVFGAGHVAQELVPLLCRLQVQITCLDQRADWLEKIPNHRNLRKVQSSSYVESELRGVDFFVLMTQGHGTDLPIIMQILSKQKQTEFIKYLGVIGSKTKAMVLKSHLRSSGFDNRLIELVTCPIGQKIGNNTPFEISISIISQLIQVRDQYSSLNPGQVKSVEFENSL